MKEHIMYAERETGGFARGGIIEGRAERVGNADTAKGAEARQYQNPQEFQQRLAAPARLAKIGSAPLMSEWSSVKAATRPVPAATRESAIDWSTPSAVIIDFAQARRSRHAARVGEESPNEIQYSPTLTDWVVFGCALMATAFYPALAWFVIGF
jgi:hypothetical protein